MLCLPQSESESEVAQLCPTFRDPMDCSPPGSSIHGIFQARELEWGAIAFSNILNQSILKELSPEYSLKGNGNPLQYSFLENLMDRGAL